jgi:uncharacterized cupredoxin-like copper-binding protein
VRNAARCLVFLPVLGLFGLVAACGGSERDSAASRTVRVTISDFKIAAPKRVGAGDVVFLVHNKGPDVHEFIVVRTAAALPLRADAITADEDAFEQLTVGALEPGAPGTTRRLRAQLKPGHYELICNMSGHYLGGMRAEVRAG